jgi:hypothetical protein
MTTVQAAIPRSPSKDATLRNWSVTQAAFFCFAARLQVQKGAVAGTAEVDGSFEADGHQAGSGAESSCLDSGRPSPQRPRYRTLVRYLGYLSSFGPGRTGRTPWQAELRPDRAVAASSGARRVLTAHEDPPDTYTHAALPHKIAVTARTPHIPAALPEPPTPRSSATAPPANRS